LDKPVKSPKVAVQRSTLVDCEQIIPRLIASIGFDSPRERDTIVIKPNLGDINSPDTGSTTHPFVVESIINFLRKSGYPEIVIAESNHPVGTADEAFEQLGYRELSERLGVRLVNLSMEKKVRLALNGDYFQTLLVPEILMRATNIINVAKLKTHVQYRMSCAMKNIFGLVPQRNRGRYHPFLNEVLCDLMCVYDRQLCVIDGIVGMEGQGPSQGFPKAAGVVIVGNNAVAADIVAAKIMGFRPSQIPYLKYAMNRLDIREDSIDIVGDIDGCKQRFEFIPFASYLLYRSALRLARTGLGISKTLGNFAELLKLAAPFFLIRRQGFAIDLSSGAVLELQARLYARGTMKRVLTKAKALMRAI